MTGVCRISWYTGDALPDTTLNCATSPLKRQVLGPLFTIGNAFILRSCEVSELRVWVLEWSYHSPISPYHRQHCYRDASQISELYKTAMNYISRLRIFARFGFQTSYRVVNTDPAVFIDIQVIQCDVVHELELYLMSSRTHCEKNPGTSLNDMD